MTTLDELRRLLAESTPGRWHVTDCRYQRGGQLRIFAPLSQVANVLAGGQRPDADAALIVALRNHADALVDVADVLREVGAWLSGGDLAGYEVVLASIEAALARLEAS